MSRGAAIVAVLQQRLMPDCVAADGYSWKVLAKKLNGESSEHLKVQLWEGGQTIDKEHSTQFIQFI